MFLWIAYNSVVTQEYEDYFGLINNFTFLGATKEKPTFKCDFCSLAQDFTLTKPTYGDKVYFAWISVDNYKEGSFYYNEICPIGVFSGYDEANKAGIEFTNECNGFDFSYHVVEELVIRENK